MTFDLIISRIFFPKSFSLANLTCKSSTSYSSGYCNCECGVLTHFSRVFQEKKIFLSGTTFKKKKKKKKIKLKKKKKRKKLYLLALLYLLFGGLRQTTLSRKNCFL